VIRTPVNNCGSELVITSSLCPWPQSRQCHGGFQDYKINWEP